MKPKQGESFDTWLIRCFYYVHNFYWDTSQYPAKSYTEEELKIKYNANIIL